MVTLCCGPRDARKSDVDAVFANIAEKSGVLDDTFTKEAFLADLHDWESAVKPAYAEHKVALGYGVGGRCGNQTVVAPSSNVVRGDGAASMAFSYRRMKLALGHLEVTSRPMREW